MERSLTLQKLPKLSDNCCIIIFCLRALRRKNNEISCTKLRGNGGGAGPVLSLSLRPIIARNAVVSRISYGTLFWRLYRWPVWQTTTGSAHWVADLIQPWVSPKPTFETTPLARVAFTLPCSKQSAGDERFPDPD